MTTEILSTRDLEYFIAEWVLIPSKGGAFELIVNGELIFSKKQLKRHAEPGEIKAMLEEKVAAFKAEQGIKWASPPES